MLAIIKVTIIDRVEKSGTMAIWTNIEVRKDNTVGIKAVIVGNVESSESDISKSSDLMSILAKINFMLYTSLSFIPFIILKAFITWVFLV